MLRSLLLAWCLGACASDPPPPAQSVPAPPVVPSTPPPPPAPPPPPPPLAVEANEAFYIIQISKSVTAPSAVICSSSATCDPLLPPDPPMIVRRWDQEAWLVVGVPAGYESPEVTSDGTTASATLARSCQTKESRLVLFRVAKSVSKASIAAPTTPCPKR